MINFAHRGMSANYPENTILAFERAMVIGADAIELDVHKTKDNQLVVIHDEDVERTFVGKGLVARSTLKELKRLQCRKELFRDNEKCKIPTLQEVFELLAPSDLLINIEFKTDKIHYKQIEEDVIKCIVDYHFEERVILSSFNQESLYLCKQIAPHLPVGLLCHFYKEDLVEQAKKIKADALHPNVEILRPALIKACHKEGLKVNTYTVNNPDLMRLLCKAKIDGIITDYPELLVNIKKQHHL